MSALERVHEDVMTRGWALAYGQAIGLPGPADAIAAFSPALQPDPRGPGKLHARDVVSYDRGTGKLAECDSIAHGAADDFSRLRLLESPLLMPLAIAEVLGLVPAQLRRPAGRLSADYFRYSPGSGAGAHQDQVGDLVIIWTLDRNGRGAESFLTGLDGRDVLRGPLAAGTVLVFRDEMFLHGVTPLRAGIHGAGHRDALIFIPLAES